MDRNEERKAETAGRELNRELFTFLDESPCSYWAVYNMRRKLEENGFQRLSESAKWQLESGKSYYVTRGESALIAFKMPEKPGVSGFQIMASHCDSPHLKVKPGKAQETEGGYRKLNVERYGGMIRSAWLDRPLSIAGRAILRSETGIRSRLFKIDRDLLIIPNVAIHMNREINDGFQYNVQTDLQPLISGEGDSLDLMEIIAEQIGVQPEEILDADISLFNRTKATFLGLQEEFIGSGRLDDLQCTFAILKGILACRPKESVAVQCVYDHEEVGSGSREGAASTFMRDTIRRICSVLGLSVEERLQVLASSFAVSADNAHSVHPNHPEKADPVNRPRMNGGIVIKYSFDQKYMTDAVSAALFRRICEKAEVPYQIFTNRADMIGGSTLGKHSVLKVPVRTVDVGLPQLAMHSAYETAGAKDTEYLVRAAEVFYASSIREDKDGSLLLL